jgi:hypothetical protein
MYLYSLMNLKMNICHLYDVHLNLQNVSLYLCGGNCFALFCDQFDFVLFRFEFFEFFFGIFQLICKVVGKTVWHCLICPQHVPVCIALPLLVSDTLTST